MLNDSTVGYFKLAAHNAKLTVTGRTETLSINGLGYAFGIKAKLSNNLIGSVEVGRVAYNDQGILNATVETGTTVGSVGLSFTFQ